MEIAPKPKEPSPKKDDEDDSGSYYSSYDDEDDEGSDAEEGEGENENENEDGDIEQQQADILKETIKNDYAKPVIPRLKLKQWKKQCEEDDDFIPDEHPNAVEKELNLGKTEVKITNRSIFLAKPNKPVCGMREELANAFKERSDEEEHKS